MEAEWVQAIAEIVTALTAGAAVVAAHNELKSWRLQRREQKMAEVAGQALVAASELWTGLRSATSKDGWGEIDDTDYVDHLFEVIGFTRLESFRMARVQAEVFLSPASNAALEDLYALRETVWGLLATAQSKCGRYGVIEANVAGVDEIFEALQGRTMRDRIEHRVEAVKLALRPYVLYDSSTTDR